MFTKRDLAVCLIAASATLAAVAAIDSAKTPIGLSVYDWNSLTVQKTAYGESRSILDGPTATIDELEVHVTTLNPGQAPHPPHKHPNEEIVIVDTGALEALVDGQWKRIGPGSVFFIASNALHGVRNAGNTPAQYHVIGIRTDKTPKQ